MKVVPLTGCDIRYDHPEPGKKSYFRMDRNELVETHDMTWEERQETIQFPLAEQPAPEPKLSDISTAELEKLAGQSKLSPAERERILGETFTGEVPRGSYAVMPIPRLHTLHQS